MPTSQPQPLEWDAVISVDNLDLTGESAMIEKAEEALRQAQALARGSGHPQADVEHVALALFTQDGKIARRLAEKAGVVRDEYGLEGA